MTIQTRFYLPVLFLLSTFSLNALAEDKEIQALYSSKSLTPAAALIVAKTALNSCRAAGFQVSVSVLDGGGNLLVTLRDRIAGTSTPEAALLKAQTAHNFRSSTTALMQSVNSNPEAAGIKQLPGTLVLGGGMIIEASGAMVGAIGVAGAPDGSSDEKCASAGIEAIEEILEFAD